MKPAIWRTAWVQKSRSWCRKSCLIRYPFETPPVLLEFNEDRFRVIASESWVETSVQIYLCRDRLEMLLRMLSPNSLVVIGGRKKWWPTTETLTARRLRQAGHKVILIERE
jgi:hypothetical protein